MECPMKELKLNKGFITQKLDNKTVIFDGEKSLLYTFNESASFIFKKIKSGLNERQLATALIKRYKITEKRAKEDIEAILNDLRNLEIITE